MLELFGVQIGTAAQIGTFALIAITLIRAWPRLRELGISEAAQLRKELKECRDDCDKKTDDLRRELWAAKADSLQRWKSFYLHLPANIRTPEMEEAIGRLQHVQSVMKGSGE